MIYYPNLDRFQLFDLVKDPEEITDLSDNFAYAEVKKQLIKTLARTRKQLGDGSLK